MVLILEVLVTSVSTVVEVLGALCFSGTAAFLGADVVFLEGVLFFLALVILFTASEDPESARSDFAALRAERRSDILNR